MIKKLLNDFKLIPMQCTEPIGILYYMEFTFNRNKYIQVIK